jgi:tetratricopeptide (TPR) repeat protein
MPRSPTAAVVALVCLAAAWASTAAAAPGDAAPPTAAAPTAAPPAVKPGAAVGGTPAGTPGGAIEPPPADASADQIADYAAQLFKQQRYSEAGDALKAAYERDRRPIFLFNAGQTYRKCGRYADALAAYGKFIEVAPQHPWVGEARGYQSTLTAVIEQQQRTNQIEITLLGKEAEAEQVRHSLAVEQRRREDLQSALAAERAKQKPIYRRPWFWGVISGVAVGALAVGVSVLIWNNSVHTPGMTQTFTFN